MTTLADQQSGAATQAPTVQQAASYTDPNQLAATASAISPLGMEELGNDDAMLREIHTVAAVDPEAAAIMVARLQHVKPALRALTAQNLRASWQEHRLLSARAAEALAEQNGQPIVHTASLPLPGAASTTFDPPQYTTPTAGQPQLTPPAGEQPAPPAQPATEQPPAEAPQAAAAAPPAAEAVVVEAATAEGQAAPPAAAEVVAEAPAEEKADSAEEQVQQASHEASDSMEVETPRNWEEALAGTIEQLSKRATDDPRSTAEAYQHVRLRLLHLANGDRDLALAPIPGLTPTEQTYWQSQLFALATLLDYDNVPDEQRRASAAAEQLQEAAAKLGELSNLVVQNVTFCDKVYGFGDYDKPQDTKFSPGQTISLYAEIDNFRSESTEKGYHTSLATSYEVLDQSGNRVEGGEFATVEDYCSRQRQDFYIEYTITLPKRVYASKYQLQLLIRDRLSGKIGKSLVEFEIE